MCYTTPKKLQDLQKNSGTPNPLERGGLYPYGTGSTHSEEGSAGIQNSAKQRVTSLDPCFRQNPVWAFWSLDRLIKSELFFKERGRRKRTAAEAGLPDHHDTSENPTGDVFSHLL